MHLFWTVFLDSPARPSATVCGMIVIGNDNIQVSSLCGRGCVCVEGIGWLNARPYNQLEPNRF